MQQNVWTNLFKKLTSKGVTKMGISYIIIFICTCIAEIVLILGENATMGIAAWVAIGIALLGVAGGIWGQIIQFKKDAQRIENVNQTTSTVKSDTSKMTPIVVDTGKKVVEMRDHLLVRESQIDSTMEGVKELVDEKHYQDKQKRDISIELSSPDYLVAAVTAVYEKNASLEKMVREYKVKDRQNINQIAILTAENQRLQEENQVLNEQLISLQAEIRKKPTITI